MNYILNSLAVIMPSYNRPEKLLATLKKLHPQIVSGVTVTIIDNCSEINLETYCAGLDPKIEDYISEGTITFIRNRYNIGVSANLVRTFEICESEWMWLLADDDDIAENAISIILNEINLLKNEKNVALIKFSSRGCEAKKGGDFIRSLNSMIDTLATSKVYFNSYIFTSNNVYRIPNYKNLIETGYQSLHTYVPHLMLVLYCLGAQEKESIVFLSDKQIVSYVVPGMGYSYAFVAGLGIGVFKNFTFDLTKEQYLKLEGVFTPHNDFKVAIDLFYYARFHSNRYVARKLFTNYYIQIKSARSIIKRFAIKAVMLLFYIPNVFDKMIGVLSSVFPVLDRHIAEIKERNRG